MAGTVRTETKTQARSGEVLDADPILNTGWMARRWARGRMDPLLNGTSPLLGGALIGAGAVAMLIFLGLGWLLGLVAGAYLMFLGLRRYPQTRQVNWWLTGAGAMVALVAILNALGWTLPVLALALFVAGGVLLFRQYSGRFRIISPIIRRK